MKVVKILLIGVCTVCIYINQIYAQDASSAAGSQPDSQSVEPVKKTVSDADKKDALFLYQNGDYAGAVNVCESELAGDPSRVESYVVLCWSLLKNKQYAEAEQRANDGLKVSQYDLRLIEVLGEAEYYLGKNTASLEQFQKYVASAPESAARGGAAYYFMGEIYIRQARYQHADISLSAAVKKEPLLDRWWTRLGYAREMAGNYQEAAAAYDEALHLNSASADAMSGKNRVTAKLQ
ncbi:MAG: tetratricopeptide repeat protein [Treponema sp.]|nr:tetratricopeptide repeat protein [Treponema sp.]